MPVHRGRFLQTQSDRKPFNYSTIEADITNPSFASKRQKKKKEKEEKTVIEFPSSFETSSFFNDISNFVFPSATSLRTLRFLVVRGFLEILSRATPPHKTGNLITARLFDGKSDTILPSHESRGFSPSFRRRRRRCPRR